MYFFTSDIHFDDPQIIEMERRPFSTCDEFNEFVFDVWNTQAQKGDTIFAVGDFLDCDNADSTVWQRAMSYPQKFNADIVLITGNNEERIIKYFFDGDFEKFREECLKNGFKDVTRECDVSFGGYTFHLVHKPMDCKEGVLNLFGHSHRAGGLYMPFGFNMCCDLSHFRLVTEEDILYYINTKNEYWDNDPNLLLRFKNQNN